MSSDSMLVRHERRDYGTAHDFLFVCGVARSGTTALTHLLGGHRDVALGMERFKQLWHPQRIAEFGPELFDRTRFFDFGDGLTNITPANESRWSKYYERVAAKFDSARYRGDKMTRPWFDETWARFPRARFVAIIRNLFEVAHSWEQRAANPADSAWAESNGALAAVDQWNGTLRQLNDAHQRRPDQVLVVDYDAVFTEDRPIRTVLGALELDWEPEIERSFEWARSRRLQLADKERELPARITALLAERADWATWEAVRSQTLAQ